MKKLFMLLVTATMLAGTCGTTLASTKPIAHKRMVKVPDTGYQYGYAAGQRYVNQQHPSAAKVRCLWHEAIINVEYYTSNGDSGHADWWQGYADAMNYYDNDQCATLTECGCN